MRKGCRIGSHRSEGRRDGGSSYLLSDKVSRTTCLNETYNRHMNAPRSGMNTILCIVLKLHGHGLSLWNCRQIVRRPQAMARFRPDLNHATSSEIIVIVAAVNGGLRGFKRRIRPEPAPVFPTQPVLRKNAKASYFLEESSSP